MQLPNLPKPLVQWDWDIEHEDRRREAKADAAIHNAQPFQVDRKLLKDIVYEKMSAEVARIQFLGAGTFHKGYLITLVDGREVVARVARRFMPNLKTESEVATMRYLRERTNIPVPTVYHYDSNPYNRLGGEFIIMSKAVGVPLSRVFHALSHSQLLTLMENMAMLLIPLFGHRFPKIGSLYLDAEPDVDSESTPTVPTPTATQYTPTATHYIPRFAMTPTLTPRHSGLSRQLGKTEYHVGPIISWPFFGSNRGELEHPHEINRGPWPSTYSYLISCVDREITGVIRENEGKAAPHKLHLDPDEVHSSRHHHTQALPGDSSDKSDEWDWEESEEEWEGPGDTMYRDYRRMQRSTFLVAHMKEREERVREEMSRFVSLMEKLGVQRREEGVGGGGDGGTGEEFALDCHDLSLENVFVDENDPSKITSIIDWESTTTRPLWAAAHVPAVLQSSPFTSKLYRAVIEKLASKPQVISINGEPRNVAELATEWLHHEAAGVRMRMAHRCVEWDGWEEGLIESILGPEDQEEDWFVSWKEPKCETESPAHEESESKLEDSPSPSDSPESSSSATLVDSNSDPGSEEGKSKRRNSIVATVAPAVLKRAAVPLAAKVVAVEKEKEKLLNATGDFCGGRGGELGRRLDAWLTTSGDAEGRVELPKRWDDEEGKVVQ
ncbi:hypothetical protein BXZ70DRAFT_895477 [Cristinia sonorae]|uniref:Aminoglycoside phosphotransferase domain-containing protein n=1 Tax=Cristinia sonorae TaxID=1940300 RepID=A0A8K0UKV7_9AGAR|nr:hypothetical protein BXZ70DRAFT_895477 [Cristinia sonorae]